VQAERLAKIGFTDQWFEEEFRRRREDDAL